MRISTTVMIIGVIIALVGVLLLALAPKHEIEVSCYDRYGHEIKELTCTKEDIVSSSKQGIIYVIGILIIFSSFVISWNED